MAMIFFGILCEQVIAASLGKPLSVSLSVVIIFFQVNFNKFRVIGYIIHLIYIILVLLCDHQPRSNHVFWW